MNLKVKRGLRKCSPDDIPVRHTDRADRLIKSYEFAWIVRLTVWIAARFDEQYDRLRRRYPALPAGLGLHWLRVFAARQNLLFFAVLLVSTYLLWSVLAALSATSSASRPISATAATSAGAAARQHQRRAGSPRGRQRA
ncbi:hypothetical protein HK405_013916 [Cladochytrium tenue]|nr:hypothetical protein HK405_013916 [Cladochytrium tenue]